MKLVVMKTDSYLKQGHVGAIVAVGFVIVCVVDKGTVFLGDAITCGNTTQLFLYNKYRVGLTQDVTKAKCGWWLFPQEPASYYYTTDNLKAVNVCR